MSKILALIVSSLVFSGVLFSKEMPMVQEIEIKIPLKEFSVIEFPFEVKEKKFSPFVYKKKIKKKTKEQSEIEKLTKNVSVPSIDSEQKKHKKFFSVKDFQNKMKNGTKPAPAHKTFSATWGKNFVQFYPYKTGKTQLVVWGYSKYPLLITVVVSSNKEATDRYIKFVDFAKKENTNKSFKGISHEKICGRLIKYLYHNKTPSGYKLETKHQVYKSNGLEIVLIKTLVGKRYSAAEYSIENKANEKQLLNEPEFASQSTYAISIENRELDRGEATRMFVVVPTSNAE